MDFLAVLVRAAFRLLRQQRRRQPGRKRRLPAPDTGSIIAGKAWVTDGDSLRVSGHRVVQTG